ncbi:MAG: VWA domain-containing protein [Chloroflexi bacterium]|nr:VWA domain-containing protein [Chloroflexota bacterium]
MEAQIAGLRPEGETNIFAGLSQAVESLEGTTATRRHIVLLTDGWSTSGDYDALLERMAAANITLSAVGAGAGGDEGTLSRLAEAGGGRYYSAANPATIPDIFLKETQQVSGQQIIEEAFFPIQTSSSPILRGLEEGLPALLGYNGTTPKAAAQTVLVSSRDDPVLAQWQYGLGRSVAWTSDTTGRWARDWIGWPGFNRFFSQLVAWTFPGEEAGGIEAEFVTDGDETRLRLESLESDGTPRDFYETTVTLVSPGLDSSLVRLQQTGPGIYEAPLGRIPPGAYAARVSQTRPGATPLGRTVGLVAPTATEYRVLGTNQQFLSALRQGTGGRAIATPEDVWVHDLQSTAFATDLWPLLLLLALLLWPLDVAIRRVSLQRGDFALARAWTGSRWRAWRGRTAAPSPPVEGLLAAKGRAGGGRSRASLWSAGPSRESMPDSLAPAETAGRAPTVAERAGAAVSEPQAVPPEGSADAPAVTPGDQPGDPLSADPATTPDDTLSRLREAKRRARR